MPTKKKVVVNRKFLTKLANTIYNTKTKKFLRLCNGTLQNGPDPTNKKRPMHCGLGELYFEMTGRQPEAAGVQEEGVIDLAVELSPLYDAANAVREQAIDGVKALDLPEGLTQELLDTIHRLADEDIDDAEVRFRDALNEIPDENDDRCDDKTCSDTNFRKRSQRVAAKLREAAKILPD